MTNPARDHARYTGVAMALHWLIALGILGQLGLGLAMTRLGFSQMERYQLYQLHKSIGVTILLAVALRALWRLGHRPPPLPAAMPALERRAAETTHGLLYLLMLGLPLTGWALVSASPFNLPTYLYGAIPWPHLPLFSTLEDKKPAEEVLKTIHAIGGWLVIAVVGVHAAAALRHHFLLKDDILIRMLPRRLLAGRHPHPSESPR